MIRPKKIKRVMGKAERRARRNGPRSEFLVMCEGVALAEETRRIELEMRRQRAA